MEKAQYNKSVNLIEESVDHFIQIGEPEIAVTLWELLIELYDKFHGAPNAFAANAGETGAPSSNLASAK